MKIKAVCERTGLTDRSVRYYIEQGLLSPTYEENYLGRKNFLFTDEDVQRLTYIAVLRKFDFSIQEIREIIEHPERSGRVILQVRRRKEQEIAAGREIVTALSGVSLSRPYTLEELARVLMSPEWNPSCINEQPPRDWDRIIKDFLMSVFLFTATWLPVAISLCVILRRWKSYEYPAFDGVSLIGLLFFMLPTWLMLLFPKLKSNVKPIVGRILHTLILIGCFNSILFCAAFADGVVYGSLTTDSGNYLRFDVESRAAKSGTLLYELFPTQEELDVLRPNSAIRTYRFFHDKETDDVFLQRTLFSGDFAAEVERVRAVFQAYLDDPSGEEYSQYVEGEHGTYRYMALYAGTEPFEDDTDRSFLYDYTARRVLLFAYDPSTGIVRYSWYYEYHTGAIFESVVPSYFEGVDWGTEKQAA